MKELNLCCIINIIGLVGDFVLGIWLNYEFCFKIWDVFVYVDIYIIILNEYWYGLNNVLIWVESSVIVISE